MIKMGLSLKMAPIIPKKQIIIVMIPEAISKAAPLAISLLVTKSKFLFSTMAHIPMAKTTMPKA